MRKQPFGVSGQGGAVGPDEKSGSDSNWKQKQGPDSERAFEFEMYPLRRQNDQMLCFRARYGVEVQPSIKADIAALVA